MPDREVTGVLWADRLYSIS